MIWCELRRIWKNSYLRQRKDDFGGKRYSISTMNEYLDFLETTVSEVLKSAPETVKFFISQHTDCVGCRLSHFCTLHDVVKTYELDEESFLKDLSKYNIQTTLIRSMK